MDSGEDTAEAVGCPIRKFTDQCLLAAPRDLSQRATSFIASQCQGIHQMPFRRLISTPTKTLSATRRNKPAREPANRAGCFRRSMLLPASHRLVGFGPAEERPRSLALHLHLSMIPPLHHARGLGQQDRARSARSCSRFRVVVPSNGPRNRAVDPPPSTPSCEWWRQTGSNRRPPACKAGALPTELCPRSALLAETRNRLKHGGPGRI